MSRGWRGPALLVLVVVGVSLLAALAMPGSSRGRLDPNSVEQRGSRALAQILGDHGVQVTRTAVLDTAVSSARGADTTLLVVNSDLLSPDQLDRLAGTGADLVLVQPDGPVLHELVPQIEPRGVEPGQVLEPECAVPAAEAAGRALGGGSVYRAEAALPGGGSCYPIDDPDGAPGDRPTASYLTVLADDRRITVIGQADLLTNRYLADDGNAALALHTLGRTEQLVWYLADPLEVSEGEPAGSLADLVPPAVWWVAAQLLLVALLAMLWRGRRLGRPVVEPLPVVVRAAEAQEGRARLYQRGGARARAAATLRTAAMRRLARRLDLPSDARPEQLSVLISDSTDLSQRRTHEALLGAAPADDAALVRLADDLDLIEGSVSGQTAARAATPSRRDN